MKELRAHQYHPQQGNVDVTARFDGKIIYIKVNAQSSTKDQMIAQFKSYGAEIEESDAGWLKINIFGADTYIKLGDIYVDSEEESDDDIELKLWTFFSRKYKEAKFEVRGIQR